MHSFRPVGAEIVFFPSFSSARCWASQLNLQNTVETFWYRCFTVNAAYSVTNYFPKPRQE